jgi:hypothetical protein
MKKYKVCGTTTVTVYKEVWANNEDDAYRKAENELNSLTEYCGNGGYDKLIGVDGSDESVATYDNIYYDDIEEIEDDPSYFECPDCEDQCENVEDKDGTWYWKCDCGACWDDDGNEYFPEDEEDE